MLFNIIGLVICMCTCVALRVNVYEINRLISEGVLDANNAIKYDGNSLKNYFVMFVISAVLTGGNVMSFTLYSLEGIAPHLVMTGSFIVLFGIVTVYSMVKYVFAASYLKRIKTDGFMAPDDAKSYEYNIKNLVRRDELVNSDIDEKRDRTTLVYAALYFIVFSICEIYNLWFKFGNPQYGQDAYSLLWILVVIDLFWFICAIVTFKKSDNIEYKNPREIIRGKKNRMSYAAMAGVLIICGALTLFGKYTAKSMAEYLFRTHYSWDLSMVDSVRYAVQKEYDEGAIPDSMIEDLKEGLDILTYSAPLEVTDVILETTGFSSYKEMSESIHSPNGVPEIILHLEGDKIDVTLTNIYEPHYKY